MSKLINNLANIAKRVLQKKQITSKIGEKCSTKPEIKPGAMYGGVHTVTMIPGDGIGPEMMNHVEEVYKVAGVPVEFEKVLFDKDHGSTEDLNRAILSIKRTGLCLKGSLEKPRVDFNISPNALLRKSLGLHINMMHCKSYKNVPAVYDDIDIVIVRQNTEGEYSMLEHSPIPGVVENTKVITKEKTENLSQFAFDLAKKLGKKKVHIIHKANIMKTSDGLFLASAREVAATENPELIQADGMIVDNCCMQLVSNPEQFQMMVTPNLYGLVLQNTTCGLCGGAGLFSGINYGKYYTVFEPGTRNTGSGLKPNEGNPIAMLNASVDLLKHLQLNGKASLISEAIRLTLEEDKVHTEDIGGTATTRDVVDNVIKHIQNNESKFD